MKLALPKIKDEGTDPEGRVKVPHLEKDEMTKDKKSHKVIRASDHESC
jgi:hypothetical protein